MIWRIAVLLLAAGLAGCDDKVVAPVPQPATVQAPDSTQQARRLTPDQYAIPWVTPIDTSEGRAIRAKVRQRLAQIEMVRIAGGTVEMPVVGPDGKMDRTTKQSVQVKPFRIGKTEVAWGLYDQWRHHADISEGEREHLTSIEIEMGISSRPTWICCIAPPSNVGLPGHPATAVHPHAAQVFCRWLSSLTGKRYRLPTEAEWMLACRGGKREAIRAGEDLRKVAWFIGNSFDDRQYMETTHSIGSKSPNGAGIFDMLGNAGEWVVGVDGKMVLKGGSHLSEATDVNEFSRIPHDVTTMQLRDPETPKSIWWLSDAPDAGFRIVCEDE